jgi:hypothetical protein
LPKVYGFGFGFGFGDLDLVNHKRDPTDPKKIKK